MNAPIAPPISMNVDVMVEKFVKLRDKVKELKDKHDADLEPYKEAMEKLSSLLLSHLNATNADSISTGAGTVYKSNKDSASIADMAAFWTWVIALGEFDMVDRKANVTAVREYIAKRVEDAKKDPSIVPGPPPGVNFSSIQVVGIRRAGKKS